MTPGRRWKQGRSGACRPRRTRSPTGSATISIGRRNFEVIVERNLIDAIITVTEAEIEEGLLTAWTRTKLALEPTGALPLAAYTANKLSQGPRDDGSRRSGKIGLILSGGNANLELVSRLLGRSSAK